MAFAMRVRRCVTLEVAHAVPSTHPIGGPLMGPVDAFGKEAI
jgi:hypothetical protein